MQGAACCAAAKITGCLGAQGTSQENARAVRVSDVDAGSTRRRSDGHRDADLSNREIADRTRVLATPTRTGTYVKIQAASALFLNALVLVVVPAYATVAAS